MSDSQPPEPLTVSQLTAAIKEHLNLGFHNVWVTGEISNLARPRSGHCYLALKDDQAVLSAAIWRSVASRLAFDLEEGLEVICRGDIDVYPPRGSYQLIIREIVPRGMGTLQLAFKQLFERLAREGLFDEARKRPLPPLPKTIAVVTSPTGAAIRDFLEVLKRRWRAIRVVIIPVKVQGEGAAEEIAAGIQTANRLQGQDRPDVLVVGRGGGSLEDLWCFNEEIVVRALVASEIPTISAVGHEIDVSLSDLAADLRALTPSEAAERVVPDGAAVGRQLAQIQQRLRARLQATAHQARSRLEALASRPVLRAPADRVHRLSQDVDQLERRLRSAGERQLEGQRRLLAHWSERLEAVSPLAILARGYSITRRVDQTEPLRDPAAVASGDEIETRVAEGWVISRVESTRREPPNPDRSSL